MIQINLLPVRQLQKRIQTRNEVIIFFVAWLIVLAGLGFVATETIQKISSLKQDIVHLDAKKKTYAKTLNIIKKIKRDKKHLETKIDVIKKLKKKSQLSVKILDQIASITPNNRLWLKNLKQSGNNVSLDGVALDNRTIAEYMNNLEASLIFTKAVLGNSKQTTVANRKLKSFSLTLHAQIPVKKSNTLDKDKK